MRLLFSISFFLTLAIIGCSKKMLTTDRADSATIKGIERVATASDVSVVMPHPRLFLFEGEETQIQQSIDADPLLKKVHNMIISESDAIIPLPVSVYTLTGQRLLTVSREALRRIFFLSYSYRLTGADKYAARSVQEMRAVCNFSDWHPSHFLDVAEMAAGVALGYDWVYNFLSATDKAIIKDALINKALIPAGVSANNRQWFNSTNNWNQVCHAAMSLAAMAVYEDYNNNGEADKILANAIEKLPLVMNLYEPDGVYPEGYAYWGYGTMYNVLFNDAYERFKGMDPFDYNLYQGFSKTSEYILHMAGSSGFCFNYSDANNVIDVQPAMYWFARKFSNQGLLWSERSYLINNPVYKYKNQSLLPALLVWARGKNLSNIQPPATTLWLGRGSNSAGMMRTSWKDESAIYVALKAGSPSVSHGHMDVGSFVIDADGKRWAGDLGKEDYPTVEANIRQFWNMNQSSPRWNLFRYNNLAHNTLAFNNEYQKVDGKADISVAVNTEAYKKMVTDLEPVYNGQVQKSVRSVSLIDDSYVLVRDEITSLNTGENTTMRWSMITPAEISAVNRSEIILSKGNRKFVIKIIASTPFTIKTWPVMPRQSFESSNPGMSLLGFEAVLMPGASAIFNVYLAPERNAGKIPPQ